jgi:WbqC-like protein family
MTILLETQYCPPIQTFAAIAKADLLLIEQYENYQKGAYRNRCHIATANGPLALSIPLAKGKNQQTPIREVEMDLKTAWPQQHWKAINLAYRSAPFFDHYAPKLAPFWLENEETRLFDFNQKLLRQFVKLLKLETELGLSSDFRQNGDPGVLNLCHTILPKNNGTTELEPTIKYGQVFEDRQGFLPDLSVLDLLFCCGPQAKLLMVSC